MDREVSLGPRGAWEGVTWSTLSSLTVPEQGGVAGAQTPRLSLNGRAAGVPRGVEARHPEREGDPREGL